VQERRKKDERILDKVFLEQVADSERFTVALHPGRERGDSRFLAAPTAEVNPLEVAANLRAGFVNSAPKFAPYSKPYPSPNVPDDTVLDDTVLPDSPTPQHRALDPLAAINANARPPAYVERL
jgi:hypothetical protein